MPVIASIAGRVINDSRGQPTVEVTITDDQGRIATASLPFGSSVGKYEALSVDGQTAVSTINTTLAPALLRQPLDTQQNLDQKLQSFYAQQEKMGVNSVLGISLAGARLLAQIQNVPLYKHIQQLSGVEQLLPPTPVFNLINGGKHANNNLDFQEYMIIPVGMKTFHEKLLAGKKIFAALGKIFVDKGLVTDIGFEGGYAPNLTTNEEGFGFLVQAIEAAGYTPGVDVLLGTDIAASALPPSFPVTDDSYLALMKNFPVFWIEDPFLEDDWQKWAEFKVNLDALSASTYTRLLVGDDLFVGNPARLEEGIKKYAANTVLIKVNQAPTLMDLIQATKIARQYNYVHALSHRSGETLDSFVSDLAVGTGAQFIKAGSSNDQAAERIIKYERLAEIEEELHIVQGSTA